MADSTGITAVRRLQFCSGHRVVGHEGKCVNIHGHNYVAFIHVETGDLDSVGRVVDFGVIKEKVGGWVEDNWDHGFIFYREDTLLAPLYGGDLRHMKHFVADWNPTAENMATHLFDVSSQLLSDNLIVTKVEIWETENCYAYAIPRQV
jgi:6-pyruvoyltetrahydropterin/6-carboxytetrahydropterin synthase